MWFNILFLWIDIIQFFLDFVDTEHDEDDEYGGIELDDEDFERLDSQERLYSQDLIQKVIFLKKNSRHIFKEKKN